ncbi:MAG: universal stress protein [Pirellulaceae bacterium]
MLHRDQATSRGESATLVTSAPCVPARPGRYRHILVPCTEDDAEPAALELAAVLATLHGACLTVLHILPPVEAEPSLHWLDAIDRLHKALHPGSAVDLSTYLESPEQSPARVRQILRRLGLDSKREAVAVRDELRTGDFMDQTQRFVAATGVDLLILSCGLPPWWLPLLPPLVRRVVHGMPCEVILVRCSTPAGASSR